MSVKNGVLQAVSPTLISAFDASSPFGCERRGYFKYVLGYKEPQSPAMAVGDYLHKMNEEYLRTGKLLLGTEQQTALFKAGQHYLDVLRRVGFKGVEQPLPEGFTVAGVSVSSRSKCDVVTESAIIDWKTSSDLDQYGKTPGQLARDVQMVLYAQAFHPSLPEVTLVHGQYQTKGRARFQETSVTVKREQLDKFLNEDIVPRVERIKQIVKTPRVEDVAPRHPEQDDATCRRCPHRGICPSTKVNPLMGIFDKYKSAAVVTAAANSDAPVVIHRTEETPEGNTRAIVAEVQAQPAVLPPDAPKSDPALAAKPVEGFEAVPPPRKMKFVDEPAPSPEVQADLKKFDEAVAVIGSMVDVTPKPTTPDSPSAKKRGRPPGSKNKTSTPVEPGIVSTASAESPRPPMPLPDDRVQFETVTVSYGVTINVGNFNSVRIDVGMTAKHGGDVEHAYQKVLDSVKEKVEAEMRKVQEKTQLNPNGGGK